jgi:hypothetical protein
MTNLQKFKLLEDEAQRLEADLLAKFMAGNAEPTSLWRNACNAGVEEWAVTEIRCCHEIIKTWSKRPSNDDLARAGAELARLRTRAYADPMKVCVHIKRGDTSGGTPWPRVLDGSYGYHMTREDAEAANRKWHEEHDPRPDHFACNYCRKQAPNSQKVCARIYVNRGWQDREFCSGQCATYDQFASEG